MAHSKSQTTHNSIGRVESVEAVESQRIKWVKDRRWTGQQACSAAGRVCVYVGCVWFLHVYKGSTAWVREGVWAW